MTWVAAAVIGSSLIGANSAQNAANTQAGAAKYAADVQQQMFNTQNAQLAPNRAAGYNALNQLAALGTGNAQQYDANGNPIGNVTGSGYLQHQFNAADLQAGLAPNYDFMLNQGQMANQRAANVGGGAIGGNALQGLQQYTQDYAGNAYQNAFNNYQTQRTNIYNTLAGIAGLGQQAQSTTANLAANTASNIGQAAVGSAAAQAAGQTGVASALGTGLNTLGGMQYTNNLLSKYAPQTTTNYTPYSVPETPNSQLDYGLGNTKINGFSPA